MAWLTLFKTKTEVETIAETLDDEPFEILVNGIIHSREFFENFVKILNAAEVRIMCAATAVEFSAGPLDETSQALVPLAVWRADSDEAARV